MHLVPFRVSLSLRPVSILTASLIAIVLLGGGCAGSRAETRSAQPDPSADVVAHINDLRGGQSLHPVLVDADLSRVAVERARALPHGTPTPDLPTAATTRFARIDETVAYAADLDALLALLSTSPRHRASITDAGHRTVGIGLIEMDGYLYLCQLFGVG